MSPSFSLNGSNAAKNTVATFSAAGNYVLQATITNAGGLSTTHSVSVTVDQTLTIIVVSPGTPAVATGGTKQFTAGGFDQFGQSMLVPPTFSWSCTGVGSVDSAGLYTAGGTSGTATVTASSGSVTGTTTVTVVPSDVAVASPSIVRGTTTTLSVLNGSTSGVTYTWSVLNMPQEVASPTFSVNGSSAAQSTIATFFAAGDYTFQVSINNGTVTTQTVTVTVVQTVNSIVVRPGTANLNENGTQQFFAVALDQFGHHMESEIPVNWAVASGGGAIDGDGLYTAAGSGGAGVATILARRGLVSGNATITVTNAAPTVAVAASSAPVTGTSTLLSVLGADDGGEANLTYSWSIVGTPPAAVSFSNNHSNIAKNTTATFAKAGTYQFLVTITDAEGLSVTSALSLTVNQTATHLAITPPAASLNENAQQQFSAVATDQFGNLMAMPPALTWSMSSGGGSIDEDRVVHGPTRRAWRWCRSPAARPGNGLTSPSKTPRPRSRLWQRRPRRWSPPHPPASASWERTMAARRP